MICAILTPVGYIISRYTLRLCQLKYLFAHHRLHEQIGLEINSTNVAYSHVPTSDTNNYDRPLGDVLSNESNMSSLIMSSIQRDNRTDELTDVSFYTDESQHILSHDHNLNTTLNVHSTSTKVL